MKILVTIIVELLRLLLPALFESAKPTAQDSASQPELKKRLRAKVRQTWVVVILCAVFLTGCGMKTVYVPEGEPVRLRETIRGAKVWVKDQQGNTVAGRVDLMEGWYCLSLDAEE